ncbi:MAG TPA: GntR family transcriptional regulator [Nocardioidaceae bacterium]|nr:GntR family transcriptional regulator [Nocardioidaceae bacterium]
MTAPATGSPLGRGPSLNDQVVEAVRAAIHSGDLAPGELYSAYQIADRLGVSRSPVREALLRLAETGLVRMERNRGFRIVAPAAHDIAEIFAVRLLLEVPASGQAARHQTPELTERLRQELAVMANAASARAVARFMDHDQRFHDHILEASGNHLLAATVRRVRDLTRLLGASTVDRSRSLDDILAEHVPIIDALEAGDASAVEDRMRGHIEHTGRLLVAQAAASSPHPVDADALWAEVVG